MHSHSSSSGKKCDRCDMVVAEWSKGWDNCPIPPPPTDPVADAVCDDIITEILEEVQHWSDRLQEAMDKAGTTQAQLARTLGMHRQRVHWMLQGTRALDVGLCQRLADVLGCSAAWLAGWSGSDDGPGGVE